jgi:parvulin-like peptidyl-prolyl isomerase
MKAASGKSKRIVAIVLAVLLVGGVALAAATVGLGKPAIPDGDVAVVDGVEGGTVSQEDFDRGLEQAAAQLGLKEVPPPDDPQYQGLLDQAMQELLLALWVEGEAADRGITVTDEEIAEELARIKEQSFSSEKEFEQFVERSKFTPEDVNNQVKLTLLRDQLEAEIVPGKPSVSDDEVEDFYEANIESFQQPGSRDVRVILNSSEAKAEQARQQLEADDSEANWNKVAKQLSEDQASKDRGGLLEGLVEGQGDPQLEEQAFSAAEGEFVGPFETDRGFYVLQVTGITEESTQPLEEASQAIKQQLVAAKQQQIASDFQTDFVDKWTARTVCDEEATIELCSNFEPVEPEPVEGQPEPPPVISSSPIAPGESTITIDGAPQQGKPQAPQPFAPEVPELPEGSVPIGPDGQPIAPSGAAPPPAAGAAPPAAPPPAP